MLQLTSMWEMQSSFPQKLSEIVIPMFAIGVNIVLILRRLMPQQYEYI